MAISPVQLSPTNPAAASTPRIGEEIDASNAMFRGVADSQTGPVKAQPNTPDEHVPSVKGGTYGIGS